MTERFISHSQHIGQPTTVLQYIQSLTRYLWLMNSNINLTTITVGEPLVVELLGELEGTVLAEFEGVLTLQQLKCTLDSAILLYC